LVLAPLVVSVEEQQRQVVGPPALVLAEVVTEDAR
jgi:hypothetical protein